MSEEGRENARSARDEVPSFLPVRGWHPSAALRRTAGLTLLLGAALAWALQLQGRADLLVVALLALVVVVALIERARLHRRPLRIERDTVVYDRTRLSRADLQIEQAAWLGGQGRRGDALVLRSGGRELVVAARGGATSQRETTAVDQPDLVVDEASLARIATELGVVADSTENASAPTYRTPVPSESASAERRVWLAPIPRFPAFLVQFFIYSFVGAGLTHAGPVLYFAILGLSVLVFEPVLARRRHRIRWLRFAGDMLTLEGPSEHVWTMELARCRRRLEEHRGVATLELRAPFEDPLRIGTQPTTRWASEGERVLVAPADFAWLLTRLGPKAPRPPLPKTRVAAPRDAEARDAEARDAEARDVEARDAEARDAGARDAEARVYLDERSRDEKQKRQRAE